MRPSSKLALSLVLFACGAPPATPPRSSISSSSSGTGSSGGRCSNLRLTRGLELVVLGSGGPRGAGRAASSYLLSIDGAPRFLVDAGPGAFVRLGETGLRDDRLDTILLTHLHIDHAGDVAALVKSRDLSTDEPVTYRVVGPTGRGPYPSTTTFIARLFGSEGAYAYLPSFRNELRINVTDLPNDVDAPPRVIFDDGGGGGGVGVVVSGVAVDHGTVPAVAYRIESGGRSVVVSGDLASKRGHITELARNADVLVYDTAVRDPPNAPESLYDLHTPPRRIGQVAATAGVKMLVLGHIPPTVDKEREEVLASVKASFRGEVRFAEDCLLVSP